MPISLTSFALLSFDKTIQASVARDEEDMKAGKLVPNEFNILVTPEELKKEAE